MLSDDELAAIEARANAANRLIHGNVVVVQDGLCDSLHLIWDEGAPHYVRGTDIRVGALLARTCLAPGSEERAQFYAGAHRDIPALLAHVRELRAERDNNERDAMRYRLLRPHLTTDGDVDDADYASRFYQWVMFRDERAMVPDAVGYNSVDDAIDAALAAKPEGKQ